MFRQRGLDADLNLQTVSSDSKKADTDLGEAYLWGHRKGKTRPATLLGLGVACLLLWSALFWPRESPAPVRWQKVAVLSGHRSPIQMVVFSPDGLRLASGDHEGRLLIWDWQTRQQLADFGVDDEPILSLAFSPDGKTLVTGSMAGAVKIWDMTRAKEIRTLSGHSSGVVAVSFSPDGSRLATATATGMVTLWDPTTGRQQASWKTTHRLDITCMAFAPDGHILATGSLDRSVRLWDPTTGVEQGVLEQSHGGIYALAFARGSNSLATAGADGTINVWDLDDQPTQTLEATDTLLLGLAASADGRKLMAGSMDGSVYLWDLDARPEPITLCQGRKGQWLKAVAFAPNGDRLAFGTNSTYSLEGWELSTH